MTRLLPLLPLLALAACRPDPGPPALLEPPVTVLPETVRQLEPAAVQSLIESQPRLQVIDCRTEDEYRHGRLPGAYHLNYFHPEDARQRLETLDRARPSLVYCALGGRSREIARVMHELGFQDITLLEGGLAAWLAAGLPVTK